MRILLIEDDPMIGKGLCRALGDAGMSVDWVRDGLDATRRSRSVPMRWRCSTSACRDATACSFWKDCAGERIARRS